MRKIYESDISREQFEKIRPILEGARKKRAQTKRSLLRMQLQLFFYQKVQKKSQHNFNTLKPSRDYNIPLYRVLPSSDA